MRKVCDGSSCTDFKSINQSAIDLFHCGHLQQVEIAESNETPWIRANCLLQMRTDGTCKVALSLSSSKWDITSRYNTKMNHCYKVFFNECATPLLYFLMI